jgi:hypothetical protein
MVRRHVRSGDSVGAVGLGDLIESLVGAVMAVRRSRCPFGSSTRLVQTGNAPQGESAVNARKRVATEPPLRWGLVVWNQRKSL